MNLSIITSTISKTLETNQLNLIPFTSLQLEKAAETIHSTSQISDELFKKTILNLFQSGRTSEHVTLFDKAIENLHSKKREEMKEKWAKASFFRPIDLIMTIFNNISLFFRVKNLESKLKEIRERSTLCHSVRSCIVPSDYSVSMNPYTL